MSPDQEERLVKSLERIASKDMGPGCVGWLIFLGLMCVAPAISSGCSSTGPQPTKLRAAVMCSVGEEEGFCDAASAAPLALWCPIPERCFAPIAILGAQHAGAGLALALGQGERLSWGCGVGWIGEWSLERGWQIDDGQVVAGVTVGLTRNQEEE